MIELLFLFVLLLLTVLARFLVFGAFEPLSFALIFLLPVSALAIFMISKRLSEKERSYQPKDTTGWSFCNIQKSLIIQKPLFKGKRAERICETVFSTEMAICFWRYFRI